MKKNSSNHNRGQVSKPILHNTFNSQTQFDIIVMLSKNVNELKFIINYKDNLTKCVIFRPSK